jgi:hypothetical protein
VSIVNGRGNAQNTRIAAASSISSQHIRSFTRDTFASSFTTWTLMMPPPAEFGAVRRSRRPHRPSHKALAPHTQLPDPLCNLRALVFPLAQTNFVAAGLKRC